MQYVITGTSSGLGFKIASQLLDHGKVIGISRTIGKSFIYKNEEYFYHLKYDLSKANNEGFFEVLLDELNKVLENDEITLIINSAKFYMGTQRLSYSKTLEMFNINLFSMMGLIDKISNFKLRRIFIVNSISGIVGQALQHEYSASKHALMGYVKSLIKNSKNYEYDVMCINPGGVQTELWNDYSNVDSSNFINPDELAQICKNLILTKQKLFIENMTILPQADL